MKISSWYLMACIVATIISFLLLFTLTSLSGTLISLYPEQYNILGTLLPRLMFIVIGFSGTFIGSYFLPRSSRVSAAIILTILGLIAGAFFWLIGANFVGFNHSSWLSLLYMELELLLGAVLTIVIQKMQNKAQQDTAANP